MNVKRLSMALLALVVALGAAWTVAPVRAHGVGPAGDGRHGSERHDRKRPHGDPVVRKGLIAATASVTGQGIRQVRDALRNGQSIETIAQAAGKSATDVLARFNAAVDRRLSRRADRGKVPPSLAEARATWFKQSAALQIDQPGLDPAFPGLHEVHGVVIGAAVDVSGIARGEIRAQLQQCRTLAEIVATKGRSGVDVVTTALTHFDAFLQARAADGKLTPAQHGEWRAALQNAVATMSTTPGLHVAGKACAQ